MPTYTYWMPNQAAIAQVETYTFTAPTSVGNTYSATINGKTLTYTSVGGDTAATVATAMFNLLNVSSGIAPELTEITFTNPSSGVIVATANEAGVPFANVSGGSSSGLVMSTGNGLSNGITTSHTIPNYSPSDVYDAQNWLRVTPPAPGVRQLPQNGDNVIIANSSVPLLWNLDRLSAVQFGTFTRSQSFIGSIGLPETNDNGYAEWRATYFTFNGPQGSVPSGGLQMILGQVSKVGTGPTRERYNLQSSQYTLTVLGAGTATDEYGIRILGVHTGNTITVVGGVTIGVAMLPGEISNLSSCMVDGNSVIGIGLGVTWTAGSTLTVNGGSCVINSAPATLALTNAATAEISEDQLTWATITAQGGSSINMLAGGTITSLTLTTSSFLEKSQDGRTLTITNSTIDGDTCYFNDPLNTITFTNATSVKQQVASGPFRFTGTRTVKVT